MAEVDRVIERIRSTIYQLGMGGDDRGVRDSVLALVRELNAITGFEVQVSFDGPVDTAVPPDVAEHLLATAREAVTNIGRHAHATGASVMLSVRDGECRLVVVDNGSGLDESNVREGGMGLANMRHRAEKLGGSLNIERSAGAGTSLTWAVPLAP